MKRTIAYHEAGHAVAAFYLHLPIREVTIVPGQTYSGRVKFRGRSNTIRDPRGRLFDRTAARAFAHIICNYAGRLAQKRFAPRSVRRWHTSSGSTAGGLDDDQSVDFALECTDTDGVALLLAWLEHEADWLVARYRDDISTVAEALLERKTLTGAQVRDVIISRLERIIEQRTGPAFKAVTIQRADLSRRRDIVAAVNLKAP